MISPIETYLFVRKYDDVTPGTHLAGVGPRISRHPSPPALGTAILAKAPGPALVRSLLVGGFHRFRIVNCGQCVGGWFVPDAGRTLNEYRSRLEF